MISVVLVLFVAVLLFVFSSTVAHESVFLGPLAMLFKHQHPFVIGIRWCSGEKESDTFTFGLCLLQLFLRNALITSEPYKGKELEQVRMVLKLNRELTMQNKR